MTTQSSKLSGVKLLSPPIFKDDRGLFRPVFAQRLHLQDGCCRDWQEMNFSHSKPGIIRGLHFQQPNSQAKLITVLDGTIFDVVVDLREGSDTWGQWDGFTLAAGTEGVPSQIYIPEGFAHGLATPDGSASIAYLVSAPWSPETEQVLRWDDPGLGIGWPLDNPVVSERDSLGKSLDSLKPG